MAAIPAFVAKPNVGHGILPEGIHEATVAEIEARFVTAFNPANAQRRKVFDGWRAFTGLLQAIVTVTAEYIDGSFVTAKPDPKDVDVSYWIDANALSGLGPPQQVALNNLFANAATWNVDAYIVPECAPGHPVWGRYQAMLWTEHFWSRCRDAHGMVLSPHEARKGYVRVTP